MGATKGAVRVGVVGAGAIAPAHCRGVQAHPQAEVVAIADPNESRAREVRKEFGISRYYATAARLIGDRDIDAVSVALPTYLHARTAIAALQAGKHVLLEKPFAMNLGEAQDVVAAARKARRIFTLGMNQRFVEGAQTIKALAVRGELGQVYHAKAYWNRRAGSPRFGTWFCQKSKSGGGALLDIGVHVLDLCLHLMDNFKPVTVTGSAHTRFGNRDLGEGGWGKSTPGKHVFTVDDLASAFIKLSGGASVILEASWVRHQQTAGEHDVELFGTEAGAGVYPARVYRFGKRDEEYEVVEPQGVELRYPSCDRMVNWIDAILGLDKPACTPEQALAVQRIIDGIYESSRTGKEVDLRG